MIISNKEKTKEYYTKNKEKIKDYSKEYIKANKDGYRARTAKRRAAKLQATPKWLTKEQHEEIKDLYKIATELEKLDGIARNVDHIVPLQGKSVCGLHVPWNLQILTQEENIKKGNKLYVDN